jgi:hypothetical protein
MKTANVDTPQIQPVVLRKQDLFESMSRQREFLASEDRHEVEAEARTIMIDIGDQLEALCSCSGQFSDDHFADAVNLTMCLLHEGLRSYDLFRPDDVQPSEWSWEEEVFERSRESRNGRSWRQIWTDKDSISGVGGGELPLATSAGALVGYAYYGLPTTFRIEDLKKADDPGIMIEATEKALSACGPGKPNTPTLARVVLAAQGRLALDEGRDVTPEQLAALARIEIKSMRNALAPSSGSGLKVRDGAITLDSALNWLHKRGDYKPTLWSDEDWSIAPIGEPLAGEVLFVPFASDDIEFDPVKCQRDGKYTVGPKGAEQTFIDYRSALDCLARMQPAPYWKHPNKASNWGTVTAVGFRPRTPEELGLQPTEGGEK